MIDCVCVVGVKLNADWLFGGKSNKFATAAQYKAIHSNWMQTIHLDWTSATIVAPL